MENTIGQEIAQAISHLQKEKLTELRFRAQKPLQMEYEGEMQTAKTSGGKTIIVEKSDIRQIVLNFCGGSFFCKEREISQGYLSKGGMRLGLCGRADTASGEIKSIDDITSLALRLPCEDGIEPCLHSRHLAREFLSTLVISPYGMGKTTFLKKLMRAFPKNKKVFLADDRCELAQSVCHLENIDIMEGGKKNKSFEIAIRLFSPDAIVIDEMYYELEAKLLAKAESAGVQIFASFHGRNAKDYRESEFFRKGLFQRYVEISDSPKKGSVVAVLDENFQKITIYREGE